MKIPIPKRLPKVFVLSEPQHLLAKLAWEIRAFKSEEDDPLRFDSHLIASYHAMNAAITAWHMTDWIWESVNGRQRQDLAHDLGLNKVGVVEFQNYVRESCRALSYCREIATGSKHVDVRSSGLDIEVADAWSYENDVRYRLVVLDPPAIKAARDVFDEAFNFWDRFLRQHGWMEDRFVG